MVDPIVRCPYCVQGDHFKPMSSRPEGLICLHQVWPHGDAGETRVQMLLSEVRRAESGGLIRNYA